MAELNNRKRKLSEKTTPECQEDIKKQNTNRNDRVNSEVEVESDSATTSTKVNETDDTAFISKSASKSFSRFLPRNVVGTIGRKTALFTNRKRSGTGRDSLHIPNQGWNSSSTLSSLVNDVIPQADTTQKQKQTLPKYYTLKLRKFKEKFKTKRQLRKNRFRSVQMASCKELNQSKVENNKQAKLLEKLLEKHNKHLESL